MKALSIRPPWAYMVIYGVPYMLPIRNPDGTTRLEPSGRVIIKNIENRAWPLPKGFEVPQRIYIHVGKREDRLTDEIFYFCCKRVGLPLGGLMAMYSKYLARGAVIGEVTVTAQVMASNNPWFVGPYGFVLQNPKPYREAIPCRGQLGFFNLDIAYLEGGQHGGQ